MKRYINKLIETRRKEGYRSAIRKSYLVIKNSIARQLIFNNTENEKKWRSLKDKYKGKRVFVIGNGGSLNKTPLYLLKDEYKICFNRFNMMFERINWLPNFYMVDDELVLNDMVHEIENIIPSTEMSFFPDIHRSGKIFRGKIKEASNILWFYHTFGEFSSNLPFVGPGNTVVYSAVQVLFFLGFSEIILIGVDMNYQIHKTVKTIGTVEEIESTKDDDPNHFDPRYFGKGRKYHQPFNYIVQGMLDSMERIAAAAAVKQDVKVINAGYDSKVTNFVRIDFEELFTYGKKEKQELFNECVRKVSGYPDVDVLNQNSKVVVKLGEDLDLDVLPSFSTDVDVAIGVINKAIHSHIPLGPFNGKYYFVKRNGQ